MKTKKYVNVTKMYPYKIKDVDNNEFVFAYIENHTPVYKGNRGVKHVFDINKYIIIENELKETTQRNHCKYCNGLTDSADPNVLCQDCREVFGHTFYSEL